MKEIMISKEILQKMLDNFYKLCVFCDELNIYEQEDFDEDMQEMKKWTDKNFGREIVKENYTINEKK